jgi:hypothetical protein
MHRRSRLANQIAICVERSEKTLLVTPEMRIHPQKGTDGDKEGIFDRSVISPKPHRLPGSVITSTVIRKRQGHRYPSVQIGKPYSVAKLRDAPMGGRGNQSRPVSDVSMHRGRLILVLHGRCI